MGRFNVGDAVHDAYGTYKVSTLLSGGKYEVVPHPYEGKGAYPPVLVKSGRALRAGRGNPLPAWAKAARESGRLRTRLQASVGRPGHRDLTDQLRLSRRLARKQYEAHKAMKKNPTDAANHVAYLLVRRPLGLRAGYRSDVDYADMLRQYRAYARLKKVRGYGPYVSSVDYVATERGNPASKKSKAKYQALVASGDYAGAARTMKRIHAGLKGHAASKTRTQMAFSQLTRRGGPGDPRRKNPDLRADLVRTLKRAKIHASSMGMESRIGAIRFAVSIGKGAAPSTVERLVDRVRSSLERGGFVVMSVTPSYTPGDYSSVSFDVRRKS